MIDLRLNFRKVAEVLERSNNILLVTSPPDGDSIGSTLAFSQYLDMLGKRHRIFCKSPVTDSLRFLPGAASIQSDPDILKEKRFDCIVVFDAGDLRYAGIDTALAESSFKKPFIINFDHHVYNQQFGDINLVYSGASSTTHLLYNYFKENKVPINKEMAACLLAGILTDTGGFFNPATTFESLEAASQLLRRGVRFNKVASLTLKNKSINTLKLWGEALVRLRLNRELGIATTVITQADLEKNSTSEGDVEGIANFLNNLDGVKAVLVLKEVAGGKIKGSLRTCQPDVDVSTLAVAMGGGGHKKAAGFTVDLKLSKQGEGWLLE